MFGFFFVSSFSPGDFFSWGVGFGFEIRFSNSFCASSSIFFIFIHKVNGLSTYVLNVNVFFTHFKIEALIRICWLLVRRRRDVEGKVTHELETLCNSTHLLSVPKLSHKLYYPHDSIHAGFFLTPWVACVTRPVLTFNLIPSANILSSRACRVLWSDFIT